MTSVTNARAPCTHYYYYFFFYSSRSTSRVPGAPKCAFRGGRAVHARTHAIPVDYRLRAVWQPLLLSLSSSRSPTALLPPTVPPPRLRLLSKRTGVACLPCRFPLPVSVTNQSGAVHRLRTVEIVRSVRPINASREPHSENFPGRQ